MICFFQPDNQRIIVVDSKSELSEETVSKLTWLFGNAEKIEKDTVKGHFVGPRREMITPWSTNAVEITQNMGIKGIEDYAFQNWTENGTAVCEEPDYTFVATGNRDLTVHFLYTEGVDEQDGTIFVVYPNPADDRLTVSADGPRFGVEVFNMAGARVYSQKECSDAMEISLSGLSAGVYFVRMTTGDTVVTRKFMKK